MITYAAVFVIGAMTGATIGLLTAAMLAAADDPDDLVVPRPIRHN